MSATKLTPDTLIVEVATLSTTARQIVPLLVQRTSRQIDPRIHTPVAYSAGPEPEVTVAAMRPLLLSAPPDAIDAKGNSGGGKRPPQPRVPDALAEMLPLLVNYRLLCARPINAFGAVSRSSRRNRALIGQAPRQARGIAHSDLFAYPCHLNRSG